MFRTLVAAITFLIAFGSGAVSAEPAMAKADLMKQAAEVATICSTYMPDSKAAKAALKKAGFRYEGSDGSYHIYTLNGRRIVAGTSVTLSKRQECLVSVSKMTPAEAEQLIQPWLKLAKAKPVNGQNTVISKAWLGTFKNGPVALGISDQADFGIMRGAAIIATSVN